MTNDPRDLDGRRLQAALRRLGRDPALRRELIELLKRAEPSIAHAGSVRDDITGPIVEALHEDDDVYEKTLADGTRFRYLFRTKIARDFLMSGAAPSHVWEPQTTKLLLELAARSRGDAIVGGAYFGDQAILLARRLAGDGRRVHCFEPNPDQSAMLRQNAELNGLDNVEVNRLGLWSRSGVQLRLDGFDSFANAVESSDADEGGFRTVTIDDYRAQRGIAIGIIQVDIEGAELGALQGAEATLAADQPHVVFEVHREYVDWSDGLPNTAICRYLTDRGYSVFGVRDFNTHHDMGAKPVELVPAATVYLEGPPHGFNMLAVKDAAMLVAPAFRIVDGVSPKLLAHKDPALHHPLDGL